MKEDILLIQTNNKIKMILIYHQFQNSLKRGKNKIFGITNYTNIVYNMIKLFTMVKDEDDIVEDWILYHGTLFGYENLYIVDNMSNDNTYVIMQKYEEKGVNIYSHPNYLEKGNIMKQLIDNNPCTIAFPLDIDEFIVYYDKESNRISTENIVSYLHNLIHIGNVTNNNNGLYKCD